MKEYIGSGWESILQFNQLGSFDALWDLKADWFEEPNERRGGWSGVSKLRLKTPEGGSVGVFLKRQENHNTKAWHSPIKGVPTFYREFKNIMRFIKHDIPTVEPVYFCYRFEQGNCQAILMSKELDGFESLDAEVYARQGALMKDRVQREHIMATVAKVVNKMHQHHYCHHCLYSKHIFLRSVNSQWEVKLIDLEKLRWKVCKKNATYRDLNTLPRRISGWGTKDRLKFLQFYMQEKKLSSDSKKLWTKIESRIKARGVEL